MCTFLVILIGSCIVSYANVCMCAWIRTCVLCACTHAFGCWYAIIMYLCSSILSSYGIPLTKGRTHSSQEESKPHAVDNFPAEPSSQTKYSINTVVLKAN